MEFHAEQLALVCRVCGKRLKKARDKGQSYLCAKFSEELTRVFRIDTKNDTPQIHPSRFCLPCRQIISRSISAKKTGDTYITKSHQNVFEWHEHRVDDCSVRHTHTWTHTVHIHTRTCTHTYTYTKKKKQKALYKYSPQVCLHFLTIIRGGGQNKKVLGVHGRPAESSPNSVLSNLKALAPLSYFPPGTSSPKYSERDRYPECMCAICMEVLDRPVELKCGNMVCLTCCCTWVETSLRVDCPCCYNHPLHGPNVSAPSKVTMQFLGTLLVDCQEGCNRTVRAGEYSRHVDSGCTTSVQQRILSPSKTTIRQILQKPVDTPTTPAEKRVAENLIRRLMTESSGNVVKVTTKGMVSTSQLLWSGHYLIPL